MPFYNRSEEVRRLNAALSRERRQLIVVYGRRRTGKSTLLRRHTSGRDVYFQASQATQAYQIERFTKVVSEKFPGLAGARFDSWLSLLMALNAQTRERFTLIIDELPYLVKAAPGLPSVIQQLVDDREQLKFDLIVCGSSQQMMRGMVLTATAPLYGRADEIIKVEALAAGWLNDHLPDVSAEQRIIEFATWGGIPRYWELRADYTAYAEAVQNLVLSPVGVLHEEPNRLLLEDMRDIVQSSTILALVAGGAHKLSEIGSRLGKPSTDLSRPMNRLIEMGYLHREQPYSNKRSNQKVSLYKLADPFLRFHYRFVYPNLSDLIPSRLPAVWRHLSGQLPGFVAEQWETLCRRYVASLPPLSERYHYPGRWWGNGRNGKPMEIDLVAESFDRSTILVGECKWSSLGQTKKLHQLLVQKAEQLPFYNGQAIETMVFHRGGSGKDVGPEQVLKHLRQ